MALTRKTDFVFNVFRTFTGIVDREILVPTEIVKKAYSNTPAVQKENTIAIIQESLGQYNIKPCNLHHIPYFYFVTKRSLTSIECIKIYLGPSLNEFEFCILGVYDIKDYAYSYVLYAQRKRLLMEFYRLKLRKTPGVFNSRIRLW